MRKQLKLLLLVVMIAVMFTMAMIVSSAADHTASDFAGFKTAYAAAADGDTIILEGDLEWNETLTFTKSITIDGQDKYAIRTPYQVALAKCGAIYHMVFKDVEVDFSGNANKNAYGTFSSSYKGTTIEFVSSTLKTAGNRVFGGANTIVKIHDTIVEAGQGGLLSHNWSSSSDNTLYITGNSVVTMKEVKSTSYPNLVHGTGVNVVIGDGTDNPTVILEAGGLIGSATRSGNVTINSGKVEMKTNTYPMATLLAASVATINGGVLDVAAAGGTLFSASGSLVVKAGTFNLGEAGTVGGAPVTVEMASEGAVVANFDATRNEDAALYFNYSHWLGAMINGEIYKDEVEIPDFFEVYNGETFVDGYVTFAEALAAVKAGDGDTIKLLEDMDIAEAIDISGLTLIIDGNGKTITSVTASYFTATSAFNLTIKNATMHVRKPATEGANGGRGGIIRVTSDIVSGSTFLFEGCDIYTYGNRAIDASNVSATLHNTDLWTPATFMSFDKVANATNNLTITGDSTITLYTHTQNDPNGYGSSLMGAQIADGVVVTGGTATANLIIGSAEGGDNVTFNFAEGKSLVNYIANVNITIYSGTFKATTEGAVLNATNVALSEDSSVTIHAATFELSGGATLLGGSYTVDHITCEIANAGDITFKLGAGTAETIVEFLATDFWVVDAMAHFYITGWNAAEGTSAVEISANWAGTLAQYLAAFCPAVTPDSVYGGYLDGNDVPYFLTLEMAEAEGMDVELVNFFIAEGIETGAPSFAPFTIVNGAIVTLTGWELTYAGTVGTVTNGKLVLNNCQITGTEAGVPLFLVNGDNSALEVNGGVYDLAGLTNTNVFQIGEDEVAYENVTASFDGVTIWTSTSTSKAGIFAYAISELTVEDCLISPYKGIVKGDIHTMPESFTAYVATLGVRTHAAVATIKGTEIHGSGSAGSIYVYAGEATITDVITYCYRGVSVKAGAIANIYSSTFTSSPFNSNFIGLEADGGTINVYSATLLNRMDLASGAKHNNYGSMAVVAEGGVINVLGGTYECAAINGEGAKNQSALIRIDVAGGKVNIAEGVTLTFSGHDGYVFELVEGAIVEANGATINVTGTNAVVVTGAGTATFTDCRFNVTTEQAGVLFAAGEFAGKNLVIAPEGTKVTAAIALDYAQDVKYAGAALKLWVSLEGDFINDAEVGASVYVDTANVETSGLRFEVKISAETLAALTKLHGNPVAYYTLIAPMDYIAKAGGVFTMEALDAVIDGTAYVAILADNTLKTENGAEYSGTLINLKSYTRLYAAIPMIVFEGGVTVYGEFNSADNARSAEQVALAIIADMDSEYYTDWTPEQVAIINNYASYVPANDEE